MTNTRLAPDVATPGAPSARPELPAAFRRLWAAGAASSSVTASTSPPCRCSPPP